MTGTGNGEDVVLYEKRGRIAYITLNRPARLNAISPRLPCALRRAVEKADWDDDIHAIVLTGAGRAFCSGYDLKTFAEGSGSLSNSHSEGKPWDPLVDYRMMKENTEDFMSLWRCTKPTICKVRGFAVAGGSDIALCCDLVVMEDSARIGYPPSRVSHYQLSSLMSATVSVL